MGMQINTNIAALNSYRNLSSTQNDLSKSLEKLSSGLRINRAADDAAGLAISEGLRSQIGGLSVAAIARLDGISVIQTVEGSLTEVHSILQRMRDLAVQAGNDSNSTEARGAIATEVTSLRDELGRIAKSTNFNGIELLRGAAGNAGGTLTFQVGADGNANSQIAVGLAGASVESVVTGLGFGSATGAQFTTATAIGLGDYQTRFTQGGTVVTVAKPGAAYADTGAMVTALNADDGFSQNFTATLDDLGKLVVTSKTQDAAAITIEQDTATVNTFVAAAVTAGGRSGLDWPDRHPDHQDLHRPRRAWCGAEPVRVGDQHAQRLEGEHHRCRVSHPRHRHGRRDGQLHPRQPALAGRHGDAGAGQPVQQRSAAAPALGRVTDDARRRGLGPGPLSSAAAGRFPDT